MILNVSLAFGLEPPDMPNQMPPGKNSCFEFSIKSGEPLPEGLLDERGLARCTGVVLPTESVVYYLSLEEWAEATNSFVKLQHDFYSNELELSQWKISQLDRPLNRPSTQRWLGRLETLAVVGITAGAIVGVDAAMR